MSVQPAVCTRELCVFSFYTLGVMSGAAEEVATGAEVWEREKLLGSWHQERRGDLAMSLLGSLTSRNAFICKSVHNTVVCNSEKRINRIPSMGIQLKKSWYVLTVEIPYSYYLWVENYNIYKKEKTTVCAV